MKNFVFKYYRYLLNKYIIACGVFIFILLFGERNGLINQIAQKSKYNKVYEENEYFKNEIVKLNNDHENLFSNAKNLEKYAREKYLMKRDHEDVFIIVKK